MTLHCSADMRREGGWSTKWNDGRGSGIWPTKSRCRAEILREAETRRTPNTRVVIVDWYNEQTGKTTTERIELGVTMPRTMDVIARGRR